VIGARADFRVSGGYCGLGVGVLWTVDCMSRRLICWRAQMNTSILHESGALLLGDDATRFVDTSFACPSTLGTCLGGWVRGGVRMAHVRVGKIECQGTARCEGKKKRMHAHSVPIGRRLAGVRPAPSANAGIDVSMGNNNDSFEYGDVPDLDGPEPCE
jgi:hypothetical protein